MLDRESTFADAEIAELLKTKFVPVAIDQWYTRQQEDAEGRFYQAIAKQGPRDDMDSTTQGFYVCDAAGKLFAYNNNRHVDPIKKIMRQAIKELETVEAVPAVVVGKRDAKYKRDLPKGAAVVRVNAKVLTSGVDGRSKEHADKSDDRYGEIFRRSISRDNLWVLASEQAELKQGEFPDSLAKRIARFHLIDNTRGEPTMWSKTSVKAMKIKIDEQGKVTGSVVLEDTEMSTGFNATLLGYVKFNDDKTKLERFDFVAKGIYYGEGKWTKTAPDGEFTLAVAFRLADGTDVADSVTPQGTKGWIGHYLGD